MTPTVVALLITGPHLAEPLLSLHANRAQADRAVVAAADAIYLGRFGHHLADAATRPGYAIERLQAEGYRVELGERAVEL